MRRDVVASLEASVVSRVQAACNFVNAEVARLRHQTIAIWAMCGIGALVLWIVTGFGDARIALAISAGIAALAVVRARAELASTYRKIATKRIVAGLARELSYNPTSSLSRQLFVATDMFSDRCDRWRSRDEIGGRTRGVQFSLHQVRAAGKDRREPIFDGVVIKLDLTQSVPGHTVILPARGGGTLAASSGSAPRRRKDFVMVKNPAFERLFDVYSTDYYEARKLLTPRLMEVVMDAQARLATELRMCFLQKSLFVAAAGRALSLEASLFADPLTPEAAVGRLVPFIALAQQLAEASAA